MSQKYTQTAGRNSTMTTMITQMFQRCNRCFVNFKWSSETRSVSAYVRKPHQLFVPAGSTILRSKRYLSHLRFATSLAAKRPTRKKTLIGAKGTADGHSAVAYATADEYNMEELMAFIEADGLYESKKLPSDLEDAVYLSAKYEIDTEPREIIVFRQGTAVFWNVPADEQLNFLKMLQEYEDNPYDRMMVNDESDSIEYKYVPVMSDQSNNTSTKTRIRKGSILFSPDQNLVLEKYSYSNGLMHSVKLGIWEACLAKYIESIEEVTESLREGGKLTLSRKEVLMKTGELFNLSHQINLSSDLLDTPDFYWDRDHLEILYRQTHTYFNINSRTKVMNNKLTHCIDLLDLLRDHLNTQHEVRLEWMIIILILVEVIFEVVRLIQKKLPRHRMNSNPDNST